MGTNRSQRAVASTALIAILGLATAETATAAPGDLDPTFSVDGKQVVDFGGAADAATDIAVGAGGSIFVAGTIKPSEDGQGDIALARLTPAGDLDAGFSSDGVAIVDLGGNDAAVAVAPTSDGGAYVASPTAPGPGNQLTVLKFAADGRLDSGFSEDGVATTLVDGFNAIARDVAVAPDGSAVVAGVAHETPEKDFALARFGPDGSPDPTFDGNGTRRIDLGGLDSAESVAVLSDARILVAGGTVARTEQFPFNKLRPTLVRLLPSGEFDSAFGSGGVVQTSQLTPNGFTNLVLGPSETFAAGGQLPFHFAPEYESYEQAFIRGFTSSGTAVYQPDSELIGVALGGFGLVGERGLAVGYSVDYCARFGGCARPDVILTLFSPTGKRDEEFGGFADGFTRTDFGFGSDRAGPLVVQSDGRILVSATSESHEGADAAVARYLISDGVRDADADGLAADRDVCEGSFAPADPSGCQREPRGVTIARKRTGFRGEVTSEYAPCTRGGAVRLYRRRRGEDELLGKTRSSVNGDWSVKTPRRQGRYYAMLPEYPLYEVLCTAARSRSIAGRGGQ